MNHSLQDIVTRDDGVVEVELGFCGCMSTQGVFLGFFLENVCNPQGFGETGSSQLCTLATELCSI